MISVVLADFLLRYKLNINLSFDGIETQRVRPQ